MDDNGDGDDLILPPGMPEDLAAKIRSMFDRKRMEMQDIRLSITRLFREADKDTLDTLTHLFAHAAASPGSAHFYHGFTSGLNAAKHDDWPGWGADISAEMLIEQPGTDPLVVDVTPPERDAADRADAAEAESAAAALQSPENFYSPENLDLYNMEIVESHGEGGPTSLRCKGCGTAYITMEDRMLRAAGPGGCSTCVQKTKWG